MKNTNDQDNDKQLEALKERLGLEKDISPDQLQSALKQLVNRKVISDFKLKKEK